MNIVLITSITDDIVPQNVTTYDDLCNYSFFSITIQFGNSIELTFESDILSVEEADIQGFLFDLLNNRNSFLCFGQESLQIEYCDDTLFFSIDNNAGISVVTNSVKVTDNNIDQVCDLFRGLLNFKIMFNRIEIPADDDDDDDDDENAQQARVRYVSLHRND